jgi:hypothetical protein
MEYTPILRIPYVGKSDAVHDYPTHSKARADRLEKVLSVPYRFTNAFWAGAGWSVSQSWIDVCGPVALMWVVATRTGAAMPTSNIGDVSNEWVAQYDKTKFRFRSVGPICTRELGRIAVFYIDTTYGALVIQSVGYANSTIATGDVFNITGVGAIDPDPTVNP